MYNKRQYGKYNDKKVLHKVRKQWVTISLSLLMMIGGGAVATHISANADANQSTPTVTNVQNSNSQSSQNIIKHANQLHDNIVRNANLTKSNSNHQVKTARVNASAGTNASSVVKTGTWNNTHVNYWSNKVMELTGNGNIDANDVPSLPSVGSSDGINNWKLKINNNTHVVLNNANNGGYFSANYHPIWKNFSSMDLSGLDTSNVTNMNSMFENDASLKSLDVSHFNTSNVTNMNYMFSGNTSLMGLDLSSFDTRNASMNNFFGNGNNYSFDFNLQKIKLGDNTKILPNAFTFRPSLKDSITRNTAENELYNDNVVGYSVDENSPLLKIGESEGDYGLLQTNTGENVTSLLKNGSLSSGVYYIAKPVAIYFFKDSTPVNLPDGQKGLYMPVIPGHMNSIDDEGASDWHIPEGYNVNIKPLVDKQLSSINDFDHDYVIDNDESYKPATVNSDEPVIKVKININNQKLINDASSNISNDVRLANSYANTIKDNKHNYFDSYMQSSDIYNLNADINLLSSAELENEHEKSEPANSNTANVIYGEEIQANSYLSRLENENDIVQSEASGFKVSDNKEISYDLSNVNTTLSYATNRIQQDNISYVSNNKSVMSSINSYQNDIINDKNDIANNLSIPNSMNASKASLRNSNAGSNLTALISFVDSAMSSKESYELSSAKASNNASSAATSASNSIANSEANKHKANSSNDVIPDIPVDPNPSPATPSSSDNFGPNSDWLPSSSDDNWFASDNMASYSDNLFNSGSSDMFSNNYSDSFGPNSDWPSNYSDNLFNNPSDFSFNTNSSDNYANPLNGYSDGFNTNQYQSDSFFNSSDNFGSTSDWLPNYSDNMWSASDSISNYSDNYFNDGQSGLSFNNYSDNFGYNSGSDSYLDNDWNGSYSSDEFGNDPYEFNFDSSWSSNSLSDLNSFDNTFSENLSNDNQSANSASNNFLDNFNNNQLNNSNDDYFN